MAHRIPQAIFLVLLLSPHVLAAEFRVRPEESILAVITHKAGLASGMAHNHLIAAAGYDAKLEFDEASISSARFELRLRPEDLVVDDPELQNAWLPRIRELGILEEPFGDVSDGDRKKIRKSMLSKKQLDAESFPQITASSLSVRKIAAPTEATSFAYRVTVVLEIHGKRVEREMSARFTLEDGVLSVEAFGVFQFTDFGIKPFSAFLGMVKNHNEFHVYTHLVATAQPEASAEHRRHRGSQ